MASLVVRLIAAVVALLTIAAISRSEHAAAQPGPEHSTVIVAHLDGIVSPITATYVHRVVSAATDQRAALVVLTIDTPGGLDTSMRQMVQDLLNSPIPSVAFASPSGARVASAGVFVAEAANVVAMAPGTNIGAAHPIEGGGENIPGDLRDKITNDAAAYIASITKQRGRNDVWVQDAVRQSVSLDADQAVAQHVADFTGSDLTAVLTEVDGRTVVTSNGPVTIAVADAEITTLDMQPIELVGQAIVDPNITYLLMTIGFFAILIELFHPGALVPGVTGVVCLVLAFVGFASLPMNWGGVVLILAAAGLFVLDIKAAAHGGLTVAGLVCFVVGSLLLYSPVGMPSPTLPNVSISVPVLVAAAGLGALFSMLVVRTALRTAGRSPITGSQRLSGANGTSRSSLDPNGTVNVAGQVWSARLLSGRLEAGRPIRVVGRKGLVLDVEPADTSGSPETEGAHP
jgi:membrane-bound serine protease (ClpP class)